MVDSWVAKGEGRGKDHGGRDEAGCYKHYTKGGVWEDVRLCRREG